MPTTKLHFARFEFKYVLPLDLRRDLEADLSFFLEFDPYVATQPNHQYFVRSLYYDDPGCTAFYDKIDGILTRSKFRLRTYCSAPGAQVPQFLEVKGRHNNLVLKHRTPLDDEILIDQESGDVLTDRVLRSVRESELGGKFEYALHRKRIAPVALVDYVRRPYISRFDPEFRLTFDSHLQGTQTASLFPGANSPQPRSLLPGFTVMEVKFRRHIPSWFHRLIQFYELRRISVSKICHAMEALEIVDDPG